MSEANFWRYFHGQMSPFGAFKRVENRCDKGTPDVSYCLSYVGSRGASGWIELKYLDAWPKRGGPVVVEHLLLEQVMWLEEWAARDGRAWLIMRVEQHVLACTPAIARLIYKRQLTQAQLAQGATGCWAFKPFPVRGLLEVLK